MIILRLFEPPQEHGSRIIYTYKYLTYLLSQRPNDKMSDEQLERLAPYGVSIGLEFLRKRVFGKIESSVINKIVENKIVIDFENRMSEFE